MSQHVWEIIPGLIQADFEGACTEKADVVITCSYLSEYPGIIADLLLNRPLHIMFPFLDEAKLPDIGYLKDIAEFGVNQLDNGKKVMVNCNAGRNRSGLMIGQMLRFMGIVNIPGEGPVTTIKKAHPEALQNQTFVDYLNSL